MTAPPRSHSVTLGGTAMRKFSAISAALVFVLMLAIAPTATATSKAARRGPPPWSMPPWRPRPRRSGSSSGNPDLAAPPPPSPAGRVTGFAPPAGRHRGERLPRLRALPAGARTGPVPPGLPARSQTERLHPRDAHVRDGRGGAGSLVSGHEVHTHHAHLIAIDPSNPSSYRWIYGTGEEMTGRQPGRARQGRPPLQEGAALRDVHQEKGERLAALSMLHNKTSEPRLIYLRVWIRYVHGTHDEILAATGQDFHTLVPQIFGGTFNVPRTGGRYGRGRWTCPRSRNPRTTWGDDRFAHRPREDQARPGRHPRVGRGAAGGADRGRPDLHARGDPRLPVEHGHQGAVRAPTATATASRGPRSPAARCMGRGGVWPSEDFPDGPDQERLGRAYIREGDLLGGTTASYMASPYAYPDAMLFFGMLQWTSPSRRRRRPAARPA